jgi:uncharacterized repeat protein (TIGR01451 family)
MKMNKIFMSLAVATIMVISFLAVMPAEANGQPDLVAGIDLVTFDEYGNFIVDYTVTNQGTATAGSSTTAKYVNGGWEDSQYCPSLDPGDSYSDTFSFEPCSDFASCGGTFDVEVCADDYGDVDESDEYNNCSEINTVAPPCPDLVVSKAVAFDGYGNFIVSYNVTNQGTIWADSSQTAKYVDGGWEDSQYCPALGPTESYSSAFEPEFCSDFASCGETFDVEVCADDSGDVDESDEYNNCSEINTVTRPCPDLVVSKSVAIDEYGNFIVSYNVTNQGTIWAGPSTTAKYVDGWWLDGQGCPSLGPGGTYSQAFDPEFCSDFAYCGETFDVEVCVDDYGDVDESDEYNNCSEINTVTRPCPDLVVSKSVTLDEYGNFIVSYNVTNQGTIWAGPSLTAKYVNGVGQESQYCPSLDPGDSYSDTFSFEPCSDFASCGGTFDVTVCADDDWEVEESDEDNNCELNDVECPCPEIVDPKQDSLYLDVDGNGAADPGDILQYVAEIRNEGHATATGVTFNDTADANTILLCAAPYAPIASQGLITNCTSEFGGSLVADIGDIGPGDVVTVTFYVKIGNGDFDHVYNQGIVTGDNFADNPTDDPDTAKPDDPTDTPISVPGPTPPPGVPTLNHWGIVAMITVFAGLLVWAVRRRQIISLKRR